MNANELRIGNWILNGNNRAVKVGYHEIRYATLYPLAQNNFKPIPLTPEILEKCGFGKSDSIHFGAVITAERFTDAKNVVEVYVKRIGIRAQYLHQLQNLYFALTGEELQIEL